MTIQNLTDASPANARMMANKNAYVERPWSFLILPVGKRGPQQAVLSSIKGKAHHTVEDAARYLRPGQAIFSI